MKKEFENAISIEEQIKNLLDLGLTINNVDYAKNILNNVSYYRLIKAYSLGLKPKNCKYYDGKTFDEIIQLYEFNTKFRQLLFPEIEKIEVMMRCRLSNYFSTTYGVLGYKNSGNFKNGIYYDDFLNDMQAELERNKKAPFVRNFNENYDGNIPFYALVELFSFGTLSKFFKNMKNTDKKAISQSFGIGYTYLESWVESISFVRNICAHYGRLYNNNFPKKPKLYNQYTEQGISNYRIFATLLCMKHILFSDKNWNCFVDEIENLFDNYEYVQIELMGFPENWKDLLTI